MANKNISLLQMILTFILSLCLVLSNILVVKPINLFGLPFLANTCSIVTFPITYVLSDVFSEVYGYRWSRITANFAFFGTILTSVMFAMMIAMPGSSAWGSQTALVEILGSSPRIAVASVIAFWVGDFVNDKIFQAMKNRHFGKKFALRAIVSSVIGKYADSIIFTFFGLSMLPAKTKVTMILSAPICQIIIEVLLLPITSLIAKKLHEVEVPEE